MLSSLRPRSASLLTALPSTSPTVRPAAAIKTARPFSTTTLLNQKSADTTHNPTILLQDKENGMGFARSNPRPKKPRMKGVTEIRGPYYSNEGGLIDGDEVDRSWENGIWLMCSRRESPFIGGQIICALADIDGSSMGAHVDGLKFAGGSFSLFPEKQLRELIDLAHEHGVYVSTGGWAEHLLTHANTESVFEKYLLKCKELGFDVIELSSGFLSFPASDWLRLIDTVHSHNLIAKPELGIQFGAGGDTSAGELAAIGTSDPGKLINLGRQFLDAGVERLMIESEGITENVKSWRTDVVSTIMKELPMERVMFEAADPKVYNWYVREFGVDVNLFVDHAQIVQLECLRRGIWGMADTFGKVVSYRPEE
ncbi:Protein Heat-Stress-Associated 32 [Talaromyces pinophilus]|nr:Protein Heat-Stress-Associated 32 [Talaromyces pinophilus]